MTLNRTILTALSRVHPHLMLADMLHTEVNLMTPGQGVTMSEVRRSLEHLETQRCVASARSALDGTVRYAITDQGRILLEQ